MCPTFAQFGCQVWDLRVLNNLNQGKDRGDSEIIGNYMVCMLLRTLLACITVDYRILAFAMPSNFSELARTQSIEKAKMNKKSHVDTDIEPQLKGGPLHVPRTTQFSVNENVCRI